MSFFQFETGSQKYTAHNKITRVTNYLNKKDGVNILGVSKVINVSLLVQVRQYHQPDQKHSGHDGHCGSWRRQCQEVDKEVPGVPGPDAVVHPHTVMVKTVHTPVTHTCTETGGSWWDNDTMHTHWRCYKPAVWAGRMAGSCCHQAVRTAVSNTAATSPATGGYWKLDMWLRETLEKILCWHQ